MLSPVDIPPVDDGETLARFILTRSHVRTSDNTVKADAFIPHPRSELSLTRHLEATEEELWIEGLRVARIRGKPLIGRADVGAKAFIDKALHVEAAAIRENPNHVNVVGWPTEKSAQKMLALEIASRSVLVGHNPTLGED